MANALNPYGFRSLRHAGGGDATRSNPYPIAIGYGTSIFEGDMVKSDGAGNIALAGPGDAILGRFKGVEFTLSDGSYKFDNKWVAGTPTKSGDKIVAMVEDDPNMTFAVQTSATITYAQAGKLVDLVAAAGNLVSGKSQLAVGAAGGTASQFQILRIRDSEPVLLDLGNGAQGLGNPSDGQYAILEVKPVKHERAGANFGVAV